jgi:hypothetical protein
MANYGFKLKNKNVIDNIRSPKIYEFNLARNMALLSNDPAVIRYFYRIEAPKYEADQVLASEFKDRFMAQTISGQAFAYFGLCPMIVQGKVNLITSNGFVCESENKKIDEVLNRCKDEARLQDMFERGAYLESGLGDFLYRVSYNPLVSNKPLIDVIEPQNFEVNYRNGRILSYVLKRTAEDDENYEIREIYYKGQDGGIYLTYRFFYDGKYVAPNDKSLMAQCQQMFRTKISMNDVLLPFDDFPIVFKKNDTNNTLYRGERGVPDIQGLDTIEDALTETLSDLIDSIRKGGVKAYISEELIPQDENGNQLKFNQFNKTIVTTKGSSNPANSQELFKVEQSNINWEAYTRTIQNLMSVAINKAGMSPTTIGLTGLESINSSAESQDAREKTSLRTRARCLVSWGLTLTELFNKYLQMLDYINGDEILDYTDLIKIKFNEYSTPSLESITDVLARQVGAGIKSQKQAIKDLNNGFDDEDAEKQLLDIYMEQGKPVLQAGGSSIENMESTTPNQA